jgi:hypothetical protein
MWIIFSVEFMKDYKGFFYSFNGIGEFEGGLWCIYESQARIFSVYVTVLSLTQNKI